MVLFPVFKLEANIAVPKLDASAGSLPYHFRSEASWTREGNLPRFVEAAELVASTVLTGLFATVSFQELAVGNGICVHDFDTFELEDDVPIECR